ncbi:hypothetical protein K439DRAFT_1612506 [Ramaria rubella]|nr:hypothetical protein K439DRAFT_1612506 [Ramaria rubella]
MPPPPPPPAPIKLVFTTTSLRNVTIATENDEFYYEIVTPDWDILNTRVRRLDTNTGIMSLVAELKKEDAHSSYAALRFINPEKADTEFISPDVFLRDGAAKEGKAIGTFTAGYKQYRWQQSKRSIELVRADEEEGKPVARFHKHHRHLGVLRMSEKPFIEVESEFGPSMTTFIVSFLLAEGKRRQ